jgi:hypothetical protein
LMTDSKAFSTFLKSSNCSTGVSRWLLFEPIDHHWANPADHQLSKIRKVERSFGTQTATHHVFGVASVPCGITCLTPECATLSTSAVRLRKQVQLIVDYTSLGVNARLGIPAIFVIFFRMT